MVVKKILLALSILTALPAVANAKTKHKIIRKIKPQSTITKEQHGIASWYGNSLAGKKTASGEPLDPNDFTVAHRTLPYNSIIKITNKKNGKSVMARVNDRGPFTKNRIIDLTRKTASAIGMNGTAPVKIETIYEPLEIAQFYEKRKRK